MKYLIQNKDACIRAIVGLVVAIINLFACFGIDFNVQEDAILSVVTVVVMAICFFYNNPTSKENSEHTGAMRLEKKQNKGIVEGENFIDNIEEE